MQSKILSAFTLLKLVVEEYGGLYMLTASR